MNKTAHGYKSLYEGKDFYIRFLKLNPTKVELPFRYKHITCGRPEYRSNYLIVTSTKYEEFFAKYKEVLLKLAHANIAEHVYLQKKQG